MKKNRRRNAEPCDRKCPGDAHTNGFIDHCSICLGYEWGKVPASVAAEYSAPATTTIDLGNNEEASIGIVVDGDGFLALTLSQSKHFRTRAGAVRWLAKRGYSPDGKRAE